MRTKTKSLLWAILPILAIWSTSCDDKVDGEQSPRYYEYFIGRYQSMDLALDVSYNMDDEGAWAISLTPGENPVWFTSPDFKYPSFVEQFRKIAARNGDTDFKREDLPLFWNERTALSDNIVSIHITSDADWDETHPAGTPLDDLFKAYIDSYTEYIRNGYAYVGETGPDEGYSGERIIQKPLSEITADELAIIQPDPDFVVLSAPTLAKQHTLTFTLTNSENKTYTLTTPTITPTVPLRY